MTQPRILVFSCSLNPASRSRTMAAAVTESLVARDCDVTTVDLRDHELPLCDATLAYQAPAVSHLAGLIAAAQGIILAVPIYNFDVNAAAKNLIELTGRAWTDKLVGFICAAGGRSSYMSVMGIANSLMLDFRCVVLPRFVYAGKQSFDDNQQLVDEAIQQRLTELAATMARFATALG